MSRTTILLVALMALAGPAHADLVKCKLPNGSLYVGPTPPENCVATGTTYASGRQGEDAASDDPIRNASARRDEIESELNKSAAAWRKLVEIQPLSENVADATADLGARTGSLGIARSGARIDSTVRTSRREQLLKIRALYDEWDGLRKQVAAANNGAIPGWWKDEIRCTGCPSRTDIDVKLSAGSE